MREETAVEVDLAIRRILLIHSVILTIGGVPLIYLGDEVGQLNDTSYQKDPAKANDSRWVHRPRLNWEKVERRRIAGSVEAQVFEGLRQATTLRRTHPVFSGQHTQAIQTGNRHVLGFVRSHGSDRALILANFSEREQTVAANLLRMHAMGYELMDMVSQSPVPYQDLRLEPYQFRCMEAAK